jgi:hypothetical protein
MRRNPYILLPGKPGCCAFYPVSFQFTHDSLSPWKLSRVFFILPAQKEAADTAEPTAKRQ